jgi:hypothetical protein
LAGNQVADLQKYGRIPTHITHHYKNIFWDLQERKMVILVPVILNRIIVKSRYSVCITTINQ